MKKRIAIFHNYMDNIGGAEFVTLTLAKHLNADIYTTVADKNMIKKLGFDSEIHTIGWIPINAPLRQQLSSLRFRLLNLKDKYDFYVIAGDWALAGAVKNKSNLWYVYSPPRELWDLYEYTKENIVGRRAGLLFDVWVHYNRYLSKKYLKHVKTIVPISNNVKGRVKKYLNREADVVYPPTDTSKYYYNKNGDFWLSVNRLVNHKQVDIQLKAFAKMPEEKLVVVGSYEQSGHFERYADYIRKIKPANVELKHWLDFEEVRELYANCKGFITTAKDEDYGMTPVEAMASGKPVIAPNEGGYKETVINGETGILIDELSSDSLVQTIKEVGKNPEKYKEACIKRAKEFDTHIFIEKMESLINRNF